MLRQALSPLSRLALVISLLVSLLFTGPLAANQDTQAPRPDWLDAYANDLNLDAVVIKDADGMVLPWPENTVVVLNFWARWCGPCIAEMPSLMALADHFADKGLAVYAASSLDGPPKPVQAYVQGRRWDRSALHFVYPDAPDTAAWFGRGSLPVTVIFGPDGQGIAQHLAPASWDDPAIIAYLEALLAAHQKP